jgi:hypothetical protein
MFDTSCVSHPSPGAVVAPATTLTERRDHLLPTASALQPLFPEHALRRGSTVGVAGAGATSLAFALLAAPTATGAWCAAVGLDSLGMQAADAAGVPLSRFALVPDPGADWPAIVAALLDAFEVVLLRPPAAAGATAQRRLAARVRERRRALVVLAADAPATGWSFDVHLTGTTGVWEGLGWGAGHLRSRQLQIRAGGRWLAGRTRHASVWLPDRKGHVTPVRRVAVPTPLRRVDNARTGTSAGVA